MSQQVRQSCMPAYLMLCLVLGGSGVGYWANAILQLLAIAIIAWAVLTPRPMPLSKPATQLFALAGLVVGLIAIQLVPLPPALWSALSGREFVANGYRLLGQPLPWLPISLAPYNTLYSAQWLLPSLAILLGMLRLGWFRPSRLAIALAATTIVAVMIGALQVSSGNPSESPLYFYKITNYGTATGFFANSNHMASLLVVTIPFLAALFAEGRKRRHSVQNSSGLIAVLAGGLVVILLGLSLNGSLAGYGLALPVVAGSALLLVPAQGRAARWSLAVLALLSIVSLAVIMSSPLQNDLTSEAAAQSSESRRTTFATSLTAAKDFAPLGSGLGTFVELYPRYEDPNKVGGTYVNHVHSDYIELVLETGVPGLILIALFLLWWGGRLVAIWRSDELDYHARAASIASAAILAHSLVDYPLRTAGIGAVFAISLGLMAAPRRRPPRKDPDAVRGKHLSVG